MQGIAAFKTDRTAVSPVIGVILMVAVTVIVTAIIGSTVLGLSDAVSESPPHVSFDTTQENIDISENDGGGGTEDEIKEYTVLTITHAGGEEIDTDDITTTINGEPAYATLIPPEDFYGDDTYENNDQKADPINPWDNIEDDTISAGDKTVLYLSTTYLEKRDYVVGEDKINIEHNHASDDLLWLEKDGGNDKLKEDEGARLTAGDEVRITWTYSGGSQILLREEVN